MNSRDDHLLRQLEWLQQEAAAEAELVLERQRRKSAPAAGENEFALTGLAIRSESVGMGGRALVSLGKRNRSQQLPWHRLGPGSPVLLSEEQNRDAAPLRGVIARLSREEIEVACPQSPEPANDRPTFRLELASDEISRERQRGALDVARKAERGRLARLRDVLLGAIAPEFDPPRSIVPLEPRLDASQRHAVEFALSARDVALIHGPPGTGKTTTVVELIRQAVAGGARVLACAPSNLAVDNLLERLLNARVRAVRLGHPSRVLPALQEHTLDILVESHSDLRVARQLIRESQLLKSQASRYTRAKPAPGQRQELRREAKELLSDARRIEEQVVAYLLDSAQVLCGTLTGLDPRVLGERTFDLAVIDEAAQSVEPSCWIPLLRCDRVILAGDHCQLPPTVASTIAARAGLQVSLPERLLSLHGAGLSRRLTVQYRMHEEIMEFSSSEFYEGSLIADESVRSHRLADLPNIESNTLTNLPLEFIDTAGAGYDEELEPGSESRRNPLEADWVCRTVAKLLEAGISGEDIGVITPYSAQVKCLREKLEAIPVEIDTVDGFQGREKEAIVISLVRSNRNGEIGFLADTRRMNVALTRARRKLLVIGDSATIGGHSFYRRWLEYCEAHGGYRTIWEEE